MSKIPPAWIDAGTAIAGMARGGAAPASDWAKETRDWRAPRDLLAGALKARAEGREDFPAEPAGDYWDKPALLAEIDRLEGETERSAAELEAELRADMKRMADADARLANMADRETAAAMATASDDLRAEAHEGRIKARGRRTPGAPREDMPAEWFDELREIDPFGTLKGPGGKAEWFDVQFRTADVLASPCEEAADWAARQKPPIAPATLRDWYKRRVRDWANDETPGADRDLADARGEFPGRGVTRDQIRDLRRVFAPESWKKRGRRKSAEKTRGKNSREK